MLQNLHVKNLALIDEVEVEFKPGLNILTGETGAGKSIILGSVGLALGGRYSGDILRHGAEYGLVELVFVVENEHQDKRLRQLDIFPEDGQVILSRRLMENRSISRINGETVSLGQLKDAAGVLIDIYGQHEHQSLLNKKNHLVIVDAYAGNHMDDLKEQVKTTHRAYKQMKEELNKNGLNEEERKREMSLLEFEIEEIKGAALIDGEDEVLEITYRKMNNSRKIVENVQEAYGFTGESQDGMSASETLSRAIRCLLDISDYDTAAEGLCNQLVEVDSLLNDFNRELSEYSKSFEFSQEEFHEIEERLNEINRLKTKYGRSIHDINEYCVEKSDRLFILQDYEHYKMTLEKQYEEKRQELDKVTVLLTQCRQSYAQDLTKAIKSGLKELNFLDVQFAIKFRELPEYTASGKDEVEFMVSMNPGEPVKSLTEVASGGELSRIMLAIKAVLADKDDIETLIFDEIDVGISGRTAQMVSEKMAVIGKNHQVICITHLAQIAAMADAHYAIEKEVIDQTTKTNIYQLDQTQSIKELARILGGAKITDKVIQSAIEMKELAERTK